MPAAVLGASAGTASPAGHAWHDGDVIVSTGDFSLTTEDLRAVVGFARDAAVEVLPVFESDQPDDPRPRAAVDAARTFLESGRRTTLQRVAALDAHRAAREAGSGPARLAGQAAGDASAAAYLHPLAKSHQVGHILRAAANAAAIAELQAGGDPAAGLDAIDRWESRATPALIDVLRRYPPAPAGRSRAAVLMATLDTALRARG